MTKIKKDNEKITAQQKYKNFESRLLYPVINDGKQCECLLKPYNFMTFGGCVNTTVQCEKKAIAKVISHAEHEKDIPPMYLCNKHLSWFKRDNKEYLSDYEIVGLRQQEKKP